MSERLYARVMGGAAFAALPSITQRLHSPDPVRQFVG
jgi:hypothetical protein